MEVREVLIYYADECRLLSQADSGYFLIDSTAEEPSSHTYLIICVILYMLGYQACRDNVPYRDSY